MTGSVRFRITAVATVAVALVLGLASVGVVRIQQVVLTETLDETLAQQVDQIEATLLAGTGGTGLRVAGDDDAVAQVVDGDGEVVRATANAAGDPPVATTPSEADGVRVTTSDTVALDPGQRFRVASRALDLPEGAVTVHVAAPMDDIEESVATLVRTLSLVVPLVVVLLAALVWWLVGRTLRPVEAIRAEVSEIGGTDLHRRVPIPPSDDEVARLARTMNEMLDRVEAAADHQRRFAADASHELRSPLTRIRSELEVDLAHPDGADPEATHRSVLEEVDGLQALVDDLLVLAKDDAGVPVTSPALVDLDELVRDECLRLGGGPPTVDSSEVQAVQVLGDGRALGRAVRNVLENAARHAAGQVTVALRSEDGHAVLSISDDGPGIPPDQAQRVFQRFARLDEARSPAAGGTGLGLAIAKEVVERHGGAITVDPTCAAGARLVISLPLA